MEKDKIEQKIKDLEEVYKKTTEQLKQLENQKLRIEGQYQAYKEMLEESTEENIEELGE